MMPSDGCFLWDQTSEAFLDLLTLFPHLLHSVISSSRPAALITLWGWGCAIAITFCSHGYVRASSWPSQWEEPNLSWVCAYIKAFQTDSEFYLARAYHGEKKKSSKGVKELVQLHSHLIPVKAKPQRHYFNPQLLNCLKEFTALGNCETF